MPLGTGQEAVPFVLRSLGLEADVTVEAVKSMWRGGEVPVCSCEECIVPELGELNSHDVLGYLVSGVCSPALRGD